MEKEYKADDIKEKVEQASNIPREIILQEFEHNNNVSRITLAISYNISAPIVSLIPKYWPILNQECYCLNISQNLANKYESDPMVSFKRTENLRE